MFLAELGKRFGESYLGHTDAVLERTFSDILGLIAEIDLVDQLAGIEGIRADALHRLAHIELLYALTA